MSTSVSVAAPRASSRLPFVDFLRALASQVIVWHHLAYYGPLSDIAYPLAPEIIDALYLYGRWAVQVFFVLGGFMCARSLDLAAPPALKAVPGLLWRRAQRIGLPYFAALALAVGANALGQRWMPGHESLSSTPTLPQLLAHVTFLQDILGFEALSAGVWYLGIDLQLMLMVWVVAAFSPGLARVASRLSRRSPGAQPGRITQLVLGGLGLASLLWFNRLSTLEPWGLYFAGSYVVGLLLAWALDGWLQPRWFWAYAVTMAVLGAVDDRPRLMVTASAAALVFAAAKAGVLATWPTSRVLRHLGKTSYSLFLVHFPVSLVVNAAFTRNGDCSPTLALLGMGLSVGASLGVAALFHLSVERR